MDEVFQGGFIGVDVFLVISRFVISQMLLSEFEDLGHVDVFRFWKRRRLRLAPALAAVVSVVVLASVVLFPSFGLQEITAWTGVTGVLSISNFYIDRTTPLAYFDPLAEANPLLNTWSLGVEEQLYSAIPRIFVLAAYLSSRRRVLIHFIPVTILVVFAGSAILVLLNVLGITFRGSSWILSF